MTVGIVVLLLPLLAFGCGDGEGGPTITVSSTADSEGRDGVVTLREAILLATGELTKQDLDSAEGKHVSGSPGADFADAIIFDLSAFPLSEPATIALGSPLPTLTTGADTVDGSGRGIIVDGGGQGFDCFHISSSDNTIKGLEIQNCRTGIVIERSGERNSIGGPTPEERNVISNNAAVGIEIRGVANIVRGNYIGTDATGTASAPNGMEGIWIAPGAHDNLVGGSTAGDRNVISGNRLFGISLDGPEISGNVIKGNYIGVDATGRVALRNSYGVVISGGAQNNTVGGSAPGEGNVISGNGGGVLIRHSGTTGNVVQANWIGTDAIGTQAVGNSYGVWIARGAQGNVIGGTDPGEGNVISGNGAGVVIEGSQTTGNAVRGNSIHSNRNRSIDNNDGGKGSWSHRLSPMSAR